MAKRQPTIHEQLMVIDPIASVLWDLDIGDTPLYGEVTIKVGIAWVLSTFGGVTRLKPT